MTRADIYYYQESIIPQAILILVPGFNENGKVLISDKKWQKYAIKNQLLLVGLSFASNIEDIKNKKGYYYVEKGSGKILLSFLNKIQTTPLPVYIYGFSGGAHFTSRFVEWVPSKISGWCAYSAGWWTTPYDKKESPPGIIACGDLDDRLGASFSYFKKGRKLGRPWLWVNIAEAGHYPSIMLDEFVRNYFEALIQCSHSQRSSLWIDIETGKEVNEKFAKKELTLTGFLPNRDLIKQWKKINGLK